MSPDVVVEAIIGEVAVDTKLCTDVLGVGLVVDGGFEVCVVISEASFDVDDTFSVVSIVADVDDKVVFGIVSASASLVVFSPDVVDVIFAKVAVEVNICAVDFVDVSMSVPPTEVLVIVISFEVTVDACVTVVVLVTADVVIFRAVVVFLIVVVNISVIVVAVVVEGIDVVTDAAAIVPVNTPESI